MYYVIFTLIDINSRFRYFSTPYNMEINNSVFFVTRFRTFYGTKPIILQAISIDLRTNLLEGVGVKPRDGGTANERKGINLFYFIMSSDTVTLWLSYL